MVDLKKFSDTQKRNSWVDNKSNEKYFSQYYPPNDIDKLKDVTLLIADEKGNLKWWDLTRFIDYYSGNNCELS